MESDSLSFEQMYQLALRRHQAGQLAEAEALYRRLLAERPNQPDVLNALGNLMLQTERMDEAIECYERAVSIRPDFAEAQINLAHLLVQRGDFERALLLYQSALARLPADAETLTNAANVLLELGRVDDAMVGFNRALAVDPQLSAARFGLGLTFLLKGDFERGWPLYEERWTATGVQKDRGFTQPRWQGQELAGQTIFLHTEQGLGDAIQFIRYVPLVRARGARVIVGCFAPLRRLFEGQLGIERVVTQNEPLPSFDLHCPLLSLPRIIGTQIPAEFPYLHADPDLQKSWSARLPSVSRIGVVWSGNPRHKRDRERSIPPAFLEPLAQISNVQWVSLQKTTAAIANCKTCPEPVEGSQLANLLDWTDELTGLADTAALIANLDLVISVDTAVAHLAGALGKRVWLLLPFAPDWRWMLNRADSPWYPTMRIFRQKTRGDWPQVIAMVVEELSKPASLIKFS